jgi:hypothetical protein
MVLYGFFALLMILGIIGAFLPGLPGVSIILALAILWGALNGFQGMLISLLVIAVIWGLSFGVDVLATFWGMKKAGTSKWGQIGAIVGMVAGFLGLLPTIPISGPLGPLVGILLGPLIGAIIGELLYRRKLGPALKAAIGVLVSTLVGNILQGLLAIVAVIAFLVDTWPFAT